jgi:hypothetical protein
VVFKFLFGLISHTFAVLARARVIGKHPEFRASDWRISTKTDQPLFPICNSILVYALILIGRVIVAALYICQGAIRICLAC